MFILTPDKRTIINTDYIVCITSYHNELSFIYHDDQVSSKPYDDKDACEYLRLICEAMENKQNIYVMPSKLPKD